MSQPASASDARESTTSPRGVPHANQLAGLAAAIERLARLDQPADALLSAFFREHRAMGVRDRSFVAEGAFAYLRRKRSLESIAQAATPRQLALAVAVRELGHSVRDLGPTLNAAEATWLSGFKSRMHAPMLPAVAADVPDWLWERLGVAYSDEQRDAITRAWQRPAPFDLRINPLRTSHDEALTVLERDGYNVAPTPYSPLGIRVSGRPQLAGHPLLADGRVEVQDEGSQLIGYLVAPRRADMVVDFCAGAGGKTLLLGALMRSQGRLYAFDVVASRFRRLAPRLKRSGLSNVHPQLLASEHDTKVKRLAGKIDRVLVDAPCTGFGTLRRNPDLKWRQAPEAIAELTRKQRDILAAAATLVKRGGRLVYATCSVLPDENDTIVAGFLATHPDFHIVPASEELRRAGIALDTGDMLRLWTPEHHCDGFFGAVLERE